MAIQAECLAGIDAVQALPALPGFLAVEAFDQVSRLWHVTPGDLGHDEADSSRQAHDEPLVDHRVGVRLLRVIRLEDVGGWPSANRLIQLALLEHHRQFVLGTGQRHALVRFVGQR